MFLVVVMRGLEDDPESYDFDILYGPEDLELVKEELARSLRRIKREGRGKGFKWRLKMHPPRLLAPLLRSS